MSATKKIDGIRARLNPVTDMDIIEDLQKSEDKTARVKELYRRGMMVEELQKPAGLVVKVTQNGQVLFGG